MKDKKNIENIYPLTDNQMSFLLNHISSPDADTGQIQVKCRLSGALDQSIFSRAWTAVVERHGSMRSTIHWKNLRKPLQVVHKRAAPEIRFLAVPVIGTTAHLRLALEHSPNHRVDVYSESSHDHTVIWTCHHIFIDGWSMSIVLNDLLDLYHQILKQDQVASTATATPQFKHYHDWLKTCDLGQAKSDWLSRSALKTVSSGQELLVSTGDNELVEQVDLSPTQMDNLRQLSDRHGVTLSELLQSAWSVFLALLSRSQDAGFVLTLSGRSAPVAGIESIVGQLSTALPVDMPISMHETLADVIKKIKIENQNLRNQEFLSLVQLGKWGWQPAHMPQMSISHKSCTVNSLVVIENFTSGHHQATIEPSLNLVAYESDAVSNFPLTLVVLAGNENPGLKLLTKHAAFTPQVTRRLLEEFVSLLDHLLENPDQAVSDYRHLAEHIFVDESFSSEPDDRMSLADPGSGHHYKPPETEEQEHLQKIWQDIFATKRKIGIDEDYFELGGTSLNIVAMYSRIESRFDCKLPLSSILEAPTIEKLAALITHQPGLSANIMVPLQSDGDRLPLFGIHAQDIFFYRDISTALGKEQPFFAIQQLESDRLDGFSYASISEMAADYIAEIKKVQPGGPYTIIGLCMGCTIGYEMACQLNRSGDQVKALIMFDPDIPELVFDKKSPASGALLSAINPGSLKNLINLPPIYHFALLKGRLRIARKSLSGPLEKRRAIRRHKNWQLNQKFRPMPYSGKISVIQSGEYYHSMNRNYYNSAEDVQPDGQVRIAIVEGSHTSIFAPPKVYTIAELIKQWIRSSTNQ